MAPKPVPTEKQIRAALTQSVLGFIKSSGMKKSNFGKCAVGDTAFVGRLESGSNFTVSTYGKVMAFISGHSPRRGSTARRA
jgi:hypothetical protein